MEEAFERNARVIVGDKHHNGENPKYLDVKVRAGIARDLVKLLDRQRDAATTALAPLRGGGKKDRVNKKLVPILQHIRDLKNAHPQWKAKVFYQNADPAILNGMPSTTFDTHVRRVLKED